MRVFVSQPLVAVPSQLPQPASHAETVVVLHALAAQEDAAGDALAGQALGALGLRR